jgi:hypothetical protein
MTTRYHLLLACICLFVTTSVHGNETANLRGGDLIAQKNEGTEDFFLPVDENDEQSVISPTERILSHRQDRKLEFQQRLDDIRDQLHDAPGDWRLQRKATAYERKLESLSEELSEQQLWHLVARDELFLSDPAANRREEGVSPRSGLRTGLPIVGTSKE